MSCCLIRPPKISVVYVFVPNNSTYWSQAQRYVASVLSSPAGEHCENVVICNGPGPDRHARALFKQLPHQSFFGHDNSGWDIGAYQQYARVADCDFMVCMASHAYVKRAGWLTRMAEAWCKYGPGLYGSLSSWEIRPHLNTSGFWCSPALLQSYPVRVKSKQERYDFEHGNDAFWQLVMRAGHPVKLVTWTGEYDWPQWRNPENIYRKGDQSNCLTYFKESERYDQADAGGRSMLTQLAGAGT